VPYFGKCQKALGQCCDCDVGTETKKAENWPNAKSPKWFPEYQYLHLGPVSAEMFSQKEEVQRYPGNGWERRS